MVHERCETDQEAYEALYRHNGARIKFYCDRVFYSGIIDEILPQANQVKLRHTKIADEDIYFGTLRFRFSNIRCFKVIESAESVNRIPRNTYLLDILRKSRTGPDPSVTKALYGHLLPEESDDEDDVGGEAEEEFTLDLPFHLKSKLPLNSAVVDELDMDFKFAVRHISEQRIIGVSLEGPVISRFGKLTWVCIGTRDCVFMFDIETLKQEAFDRGLRDIFESKSIKKVLHNCRHASDLLAKQYSTQLTNVFDTQVANLVVDLQRYNDKYKFNSVSSLEGSVKNYLKVPPEYLFKQVELEPEDRFAYYRKRPISNAFRLDLVNKVLYLILLQERLARELLAPLHKLTRDYLRVLGKASHEEFFLVGKELSPPNAIPPGVLMYGVQVIKYKKPEKKAPVSLFRNFKDLRTGKIIEPYKKTDHPSSAVAKREAGGRGKNSQACATLSKMFDSRLKISKSDVNKDVDRMSVYPSHRHLDEVYHKLVNKVCGNQPEVNVKPSGTYTSTFSVQKSSSGQVSSAENSVHHRGDLCSGTTSDYSMKQRVAEPADDLWALIRAQTQTDCRVRVDRKVQLVPA